MAEKIESVQTFGRKVCYSLDLVEFFFFFHSGVAEKGAEGTQARFGGLPCPAVPVWICGRAHRFLLLVLISPVCLLFSPPFSLSPLSL